MSDLKIPAGPNDKEYMEACLKEAERARIPHLEGEIVYLEERVAGAERALELYKEEANEHIAAAMERCRVIGAERDDALKRALDATRICDQPGCVAAVIRRDDSTRACAAGHESRWVERADLVAALERERVLREALRDTRNELAIPVSYIEPETIGKRIWLEAARRAIADADVALAAQPSGTQDRWSQQPEFPVSIDRPLYDPADFTEPTVEDEPSGRVAALESVAKAAAAYRDNNWCGYEYRMALTDALKALEVTG